MRAHSVGRVARDATGTGTQPMFEIGEIGLIALAVSLHAPRFAIALRALKQRSYKHKLSGVAISSSC